MKKLIIISLRYLDETEHSVTIGGIQTYITNLLNIAKSLSFDCFVIQGSNHSFTVNVNDATIIGVNASEDQGFDHFKKELFKTAMKLYSQGDVVLFSTERLSVKSNIKNTIGIQHGISWDIGDYKYHSNFENLKYLTKRAYRAFRLINDSQNVGLLVCVDHNYINWVRTQIQNINFNYTVIPNFSCIPDKLFQKPNDTVTKIIFARRLQEHRGTKLFASTIKRICDKYDVDITIAGDGPDESYLRQSLDGLPVSFISYSSENALEIHKDKHISIVPSLGSEGTSLSLIEAMAAGCAPIATDIGGMTDIIINGYNGLLIRPFEDDLFNAIELLITNPEYRESLAMNAFETAKTAFSYDNWRKQWESILLSMID